VLGRLIKSAVETIRPAPIKIEFVEDLRRSTFEPGRDIDVIVEVTPKNKVAHVVEASVSVVLEFEIVRISTVMIPDRRANQRNVAARGGAVMVPKTVKEKSTDVHRLDPAVFLSETALQPDRATFPVRLSVPEELPRPPANTIGLETTWKLVATVRLTNGKSYTAEQVITPKD
jgi:hypothetical protein